MWKSTTMRQMKGLFLGVLPVFIDKTGSGRFGAPRTLRMSYHMWKNKCTYKNTSIEYICNFRSRNNEPRGSGKFGNVEWKSGHDVPGRDQAGTRDVPPPSSKAPPLPATLTATVKLSQS